MNETPHYDLFVSYAEADRAWAEGFLLDALHAAGVRCHSEAAFALGVPRVVAFEDAVRQSQRTLLVLSPAYLADGSAAFVEILARSYDLAAGAWRVIPLVLHPVALPPRLAALTRLDATEPRRWPAVLERLAAELQQPVPAAQAPPACPYPGMLPFRADDARFFHGREAEIALLLQQLRYQQFLLVIGPSGSGKSSLVRAGLLPRLEAGSAVAPGPWRVRTLRPGSRPLHVLAVALEGDLDEPSGTIAALVQRHAPARRVLLVVDQLEELFTQASRDEQGQFIAALQRLRDVEECTLLLILRADFFPDLMQSDLWPIDAHQRLEVAPLRGAALREAIEQPALAVGVHLEATLLERLLADAADEPGALPLVQETMVLLWSAMQRRLIPLAAYQRLGGDDRRGLAAAVAIKADVTLGSLDPEQQGIARRIFLRLVQFGEGRASTRRQQPVSALRSAGEDSARFAATLLHLTEQRLLTGGGTTGAAEQTVDLAHEALIDSWPTMRRWIEERHSAEQTRRRLEAKAVEWQRLGAGAAALLDTEELAEAERWLAGADARELGFSETLLALVAASRARLERERALARRRVRITVTSLTAGLLLLAGLAVWGGLSTLRAEAEARRATSRQLAAQALSLLDDRLDLALLLSVEAYRTDPTFEARHSLVTALEHSPQLERYMHEDTAGAREVAFSPDGTLLVWTGEAGTVLREVASRRQLGTPLAAARGLAFSADGQRLATFTLVSIQLWDVATRQSLGAPLKRESAEAALPGTDRITDVAFSPDGSRLASSHGDGSIVLWDLASGQPLGEPLWEHGEAVNDVAFSPDGRLLASASDDESIRLWDAATGQPLGEPLRGHRLFVTALAFSPDGALLASGGVDQRIRLWEVATGQPLGESLAGHELSITDLLFSADGATLFSASLDRTIGRWDLSAPEVRPPTIRRLRGHASEVTGIALSPDGATMASAGTDAVLLWELGRSARLGRPLNGAAFEALSVAYSDDGRLLAAGGCGGVEGLVCGQGAIFFRDAGAHGLLGAPILAPGDEVMALRFSSDGTSIVAAGRDARIRRWDVGTGRQLEDLEIGEPPTIVAPAISPGGELAAGGGRDGIRLWDLADGEARGGWLSELPAQAAFSPDGATVAVAQGGEIVLWDVASGRPSGQPFVGAGGPLAFSPDGQRLASTGGQTFPNVAHVRMWDVATRQPIGPPLTGHTSHVTAIAFDPQGTLLVSGDGNSTIVWWDLAGHQRLGPALPGDGIGIESLAFRPDGQALASAGRRLIVWDLSAGSWQAQACNVAHRNLTTDEWRQFFGDAPYRRTCPEHVTEQ